eukprot:403337627
MGHCHSRSQPYQYAFFRTDKPALPGHSAELICMTNKDNPDKVLGPDYHGMQTILDLFNYALKKFPNHKFLGTRNQDKQGAPYEWKTYREIYEETEYLARGLRLMNLDAEIVHVNDQTKKEELWRFMGIYVKNREEWAVMDLACMRSCITIVPFFENLGDTGLEYIINQTQLHTMTVETKGAQKLLDMIDQGKIPSLKNIILMDEVEDEFIVDVKAQLKVNIYRYRDIIEMSRTYQLKIWIQEPTADTIYMFCYTSGTTGEPKAAMLAHSSFVANQHLHDYGLDSQLNETDIHFSYLPYAHTYEQLILVRCLITGMSCGFFSGDMTQLFADIQTLKPTFLAVVPRILIRVYTKVIEGIYEKGGFALKLFIKAVETKLNNLNKHGILTHPVYDKLIFKKIRDIFGGNLKQICTGSASLDPKIFEFFKIAMGFNIQEGYGQTEACGAGTITKVFDVQKSQNNGEQPLLGHVGGVVPLNKFRLKDIPEMNYYHTDNPPRGELQLQSSALFKGYFKNPEKTKEMLSEDGWLNTGDVVSVLPNGALKIIDRANNIFKLSQGEYIAPEKLQNIYSQVPIISQIYVYGDSSRSYLVAVAVPDMTQIEYWVISNGLEMTHDILENEDLKIFILRLLCKKHCEFKLSGLERIHKVHLTSTSFNQENGLVTPTMKLKRYNMREFFAKEIQEMYSEDNVTVNKKQEVKTEEQTTDENINMKGSGDDRQRQEQLTVDGMSKDYSKECYLKQEKQ